MADIPVGTPAQKFKGTKKQFKNAMAEQRLDDHVNAFKRKVAKLPKMLSTAKLLALATDQALATTGHKAKPPTPRKQKCCKAPKMLSTEALKDEIAKQASMVSRGKSEVEKRCKQQGVTMGEKGDYGQDFEGKKVGRLAQMADKAAVGARPAAKGDQLAKPAGLGVLPPGSALAPKQKGK